MELHDVSLDVDSGGQSTDLCRASDTVDLCASQTAIDVEIEETTQFNVQSETLPIEIQASPPEDADEVEAIENHYVPMEALPSRLRKRARPWQGTVDSANDGDKKDAGELTIIFKPGPSGLHLEQDDSGLVTKIVDGEQAARLGVRAWMRCVLINGEPFTALKLRDAVHGSDDYEVTFEQQKPAIHGMKLAEQELQDMGDSPKPDTCRPLMMVFSTTNGMQEIAFTRAPLGMDFTKKQPQIVRRVHITGHASELGVQPGWVINSLNAESMEGKPFEFIYAALKAASSNLPAVLVNNLPPPLSIVFRRPDKSTKQFSFTKLPFGLELAQTRFKLCETDRLPSKNLEPTGPKALDPALVRGVTADSHAAELGVQVGWVITTINGEDMAGKDFDNFRRKLCSGSRAGSKV